MSAETSAHIEPTKNFPGNPEFLDLKGEDINSKPEFLLKQLAAKIETQAGLIYQALSEISVAPGADNQALVDSLLAESRDHIQTFQAESLSIPPETATQKFFELQKIINEQNFRIEKKAAELLKAAESIKNRLQEISSEFLGNPDLYNDILGAEGISKVISQSTAEPDRPFPWLNRVHFGEQKLMSDRLKSLAQILEDVGNLLRNSQHMESFYYWAGSVRQAINILQELSKLFGDLEGKMQTLIMGDSPDLSKKIFDKYNEIVRMGKYVRNCMDEYFGSQSGIIDADLLVKNLLQRANHLLTNYSGQLNRTGTPPDQKSLVEQLNQVEAEVLVFASGIKSAVKGERVEWRNVPGVSEQEKDSSELLAEEKQAMLQIFKANRENTYPKKLFEATVRDFEKTLNESGHAFRLLYHNNSLLAFFHYDRKDEDKEIYVGSLNLNPNATDTPIAVSMVKDAMAEKQDYKLRAVVWAKNPARLFYTKFLGLKKVGEIADYDGTGELYWNLERPAQETRMELPKAA